MPKNLLADPARLTALNHSELLQGRSRPQFDLIADLVRDMLDVPVAIVSMVSDEKQVFAGQRGLPPEWAMLGETPLSHSFCQHVVNHDAPLLVVDARRDMLVRDNLAVQDLRVIAYLGVPLHLPTGEVIGALAAISDQPRDWTDTDMDRLRRVGNMADAEIAVRMSELKWRRLFEDMQEGFFIGEAVRDDSGRMIDWRYHDTNPAFHALTGSQGQKVAGRLHSDLLPNTDPAILAAFAGVLATGTPAVVEACLPNLDGRWLEARARALDANRFAVLFSNITERKQQEEQAAATEARRRLAAEVGDVGLWEWNLDDDVLTLDRRMLDMNGVSGDAFETARIFDAIHPDDRQRVDAALDDLAKGGVARLDLSYRVIGIEDGVVRTVLVNGVALRDNLTGKRLLIGAARDITAQAIHEERRLVLNRELSHRLKNTLAVVGAIVTQTLRRASDLDSAKTDAMQRIRALATSHDILLDGRKEAGTIGALVRAAVAVHDDGARLEIQGPQVQVGSDAALSISLILHELATNALKYGALSVPDGRVSIGWQIAHDPECDAAALIFDWAEHNGPPATAPQSQGFGTQLIEMGFAGSGQSRSELHFEPTGLRCRITTPLADLAASGVGQA